MPTVLQAKSENGTPFGTLARQIKILARLDTLACQVEKFTRLCHTGTLVRLLSRWHVTMRGWHAFGTFARMTRMARDLPNS